MWTFYLLSQISREDTYHIFTYFSKTFCGVIFTCEVMLCLKACIDLHISLPVPRTKPAQSTHKQDYISSLSKSHNESEKCKNKTQRRLGKHFTQTQTTLLISFCSFETSQMNPCWGFAWPRPGQCPCTVHNSDPHVTVQATAFSNTQQQFCDFNAFSPPFTQSHEPQMPEQCQDCLSMFAKNRWAHHSSRSMGTKLFICGFGDSSSYWIGFWAPSGLWDELFSITSCQASYTNLTLSSCAGVKLSSWWLSPLLRAGARCWYFFPFRRLKTILGAGRSGILHEVCLCLKSFILLSSCCVGPELPVRRWVTSLLGPLVIVYILRWQSHL